MKTIQPLSSANVIAVFAACALASDTKAKHMDFTNPTSSSEKTKLSVASVDGKAEQIVTWLKGLQDKVKKTKGCKGLSYEPFIKTVGGTSSWAANWLEVGKLIGLGMASGYIHELGTAEKMAAALPEIGRFFIVLDDKFPA